MALCGGDGAAVATKWGTWTWGSSKDGSVSRSVSVFVLRWRPERSPGPGRLTTQVGTRDHAGQDAKPAPHRLPLLCGVRWRSPPRRSPAAIGRWVLSVGASHPVPSASESFPGQGVVHDGPGVRRPVWAVETLDITTYEGAHVSAPIRPGANTLVGDAAGVYREMK